MTSAPNTQQQQRIPWYLWLGAAAMTSVALGEEWDVSWHRSIGRDSFFTPAHAMIYLCGLLAAVLGLWLLAQCTFGRNAALRNASIKVFGLHAPLGVFLAGWGGLAMLTAGPFDQWWHAAYGLDVQLVSPPHVLLVLGIRLVDLGILLLAVSALNRALGTIPGTPTFTPGAPSSAQLRASEVAAKVGSALSGQASALQRLILYLGGLILIGQMFFMLGYTRDITLHRAAPYQALALALPMAFAAIHIASRHRWSATIAAALYTALLLVGIQLLPLFPAHPRLGPVFTPITHMVPQKFPPLILAPAFALDLLWQRTRTWKMLPLALVSGIVFTAVLVTVEWPFATLLMTKLSHSRFFGTTYFAFDARPDRWDRMRTFFFPMNGWPLVRGLTVAALYAAGSSYVGLLAGKWMRTIQR